jgi:hypothetical protein
MAIEDDLRVLLSTYPVGEYLIDTLQISHSLFSQDYYLTREPGGLVALIEGSISKSFTGSNIEITLNSTKSDLDQNFSFTIQDLENVFDDELDLIPLDNTEDILLTYRGFLSSDLSEPAQGPIVLEAISASQEKGKFTISAGAPQLNWNKTGVIYSYDDFPMLRAV